MKKILTFISIIALACGVSAQTFEKDYTYGFWSNWSLGASVQYSKNFTSDWAFGEGSNIGFDIRAQKQLGQHWDMRIMGNIPGLLTSDTNQFDRYATGLVGFAWTPKNYFYLFVDGGIGVKRDSYNWLALAADAGIGAKFNVCKSSTLFCELGLDCVADITADMTYTNAFVKFGWMHRFGLTNVDKQIMEQRKSIATNPIMVAAREHNDSLANELKDCRMNESNLIRRISILEIHDSALTAEVGRLTRDNDSLQNIISSIQDNQLNYYALPFSILFDNDSYTINNTEREKLKAVASIMKDDTTIHYAVTGFCDKTGSREYNQRLSEKRANAVKDALVKYGVKEEQLTVNGNGFDKPFSDGMLQVNRRVSFYRNF